MSKQPLESAFSSIAPVDVGRYIITDANVAIGTYGAMTCFGIILYNKETGRRFCAHIGKLNDPRKEIEAAFKICQSGGGKISVGVVSNGNSSCQDEVLKKETEDLFKFFDEKNLKGEIGEYLNSYGKDTSIAISEGGAMVVGVKMEDFTKKIDWEIKNPREIEFWKGEKLPLLDQGDRDLTQISPAVPIKLIEATRWSTKTETAQIS